MYFDAVLTSRLVDVIFNGTPEEVREFLEKAIKEDKIRFDDVVCRGRDMRLISIEEYLAS